MGCLKLKVIAKAVDSLATSTHFELAKITLVLTLCLEISCWDIAQLRFLQEFAMVAVE